MESKDSSTPIESIFYNAKQRSVIERKSSIKHRKANLSKLQNWIINNRVKINEAVFKDLSKPFEETEITELLVVINEIKEAKRNLRQWMSKKYKPGGLLYFGSSAYVYHEPKGLCLIMAPWNFPFQLTIGPLISAIAAGNTAIIKPSEVTPNTSRLIAEMISELFPPELYSVVEGGIEVSQELLKLPFNHIFFTGSPQIGKKVMEAASKNLTSVTLELGGKSPVIVDKSANIKDAAQKIAWGKWMNAGQVCIAPDYLFVHRSIKEAFINELSIAAKKLYGKDKSYASIVNEKHYNRLIDLLSEAKEKNVTLEFGGEVEKQNLKIYPTVLTEIPNGIGVMEEEIFGPLLPIIAYEDTKEVIQLINEKPKALSLYLFSKDKKQQEKISCETSAGMMAINEVVFQFAHPTLPFGGINNSGIGKSHGYDGFLEFSNQKSIMKQRIGLTTIKLLYPPYNGLKRIMIDFVMKYL